MTKIDMAVSSYIPPPDRMSIVEKETAALKYVISKPP